MNNVHVAQKALVAAILETMEDKEDVYTLHKLLLGLNCITDDLEYRGSYNDGTPINYLWSDAGVSREDSQRVSDLMLEVFMDKEEYKVGQSVDNQPRMFNWGD